MTTGQTKNQIHRIITITIISPAGLFLNSVAVIRLLPLRKNHWNQTVKLIRKIVDYSHIRWEKTQAYYKTCNIALTYLKETNYQRGFRLLSYIKNCDNWYEITNCLMCVIRSINWLINWLINLPRTDWSGHYLLLAIAYSAHLRTMVGLASTWLVNCVVDFFLWCTKCEFSGEKETIFKLRMTLSLSLTRYTSLCLCIFSCRSLCKLSFLR